MAEAPAAAKDKKILLAEDNPTNQLLAVAILKRLGYAADVVSNGQEALAACRGTDYDLIFMDCQMPEMDGFEATRRIRESENGSARRVPIVALTANVLQEDRDKCHAVGMDDFVAKPIRRDFLANVLQSIFARPAA